MLSPLATQVFATHIGQMGGRGLSPRLWALGSGQGVSPDGMSNAFFQVDDFLNMPPAAPAVAGPTAHILGGYAAYVDSATTASAIRQLANEVGGILELRTGGTNNHQAYLTSGGNTGTLGKIDDAPGEQRLVLFETRVRPGQISNDISWFVGLAEEGLAATNTMATTGLLADKDFVGFHVLKDAGSTLRFVYRKEGQAVQIPVANLATLQADRWYKLGFAYNPVMPQSKRLKIFVDNEEYPVTITAQQISAATFPKAEHLAFLAGVRTGAASARFMALDWWAFLQHG